MAEETTQAGAQATPQEEMRIFALLVGINEYEPREDVPQLGGCVNDVEAMENLLVTYYGVPDSKDAEGNELPDAAKHIVKLTNAQATRAAIIETFQSHLINNPAIQHGDQILFYYSGHGSRMPDPTGTESTGKWETLVAHDSRTEGQWDIPDKTLAALLAQLALAKGNNITFISDSCHSGDISRDVAARARMTSADTRMPPKDLDGEIRAKVPGQHAVGTAGYTVISLNEEPTHVLIAGCRNDQSSKEYTVSLDDGTQAQRGAMTWHLINYLQARPSGATYRDLIQDVGVRVTALFNDQHPQAQGKDERTVLGDATLNRDPYFVVRKVGTGTVTLAGGQLQGVTVGSELHLYPETVRLREQMTAENRVAIVKVIRSHPTTAEAEVDTESLQGTVELAQRAFMHRQVITSAPLRVRLGKIAPPDSADVPPENVTTEPLDPATQTLFDDVRTQITHGDDGNPNLFLTLVEDATAQILVYPYTGADEERYIGIFDPAGKPQYAEPAGASAATVVERLESIARYNLLLNFKNSNSTALNDAIQVTLVSAPEYERDQTKGVVTKSKDGVYHLTYDPRETPDEQTDLTSNIYYLFVKNDSEVEVFINVLLLSNYGIGSLYPVETDSREMALQPGKTLRVGKVTEHWLEVSVGPDDSASRDYVLVMATRHPTDLSALHQRAAKRPPMPKNTRNIGGEMDDMIERLVRRTRGDGTATVSRDIAGGRRTNNDWTTVLLTLETVPAGAAVTLREGEETVTLDTITVNKPAGVTGTFKVSTVEAGTRSTGVAIPLPPLFREQAPTYRVAGPGGTRGLTENGLMIEMEMEAEDRAQVTPDSPLTLTLPASYTAGADELIPIYFDGEDFIVGGADVGNGQVQLTHVPAARLDRTPGLEEANKAVNRDIKRILRLFVFKKTGRHIPELGLHRTTIDRAERGAIEVSKVVKGEIKHGERVAVLVHGFGSETDWMVRGLQAIWDRVQRDNPAFKYDHVLTYNYESFGTAITENGQNLFTALHNQAGLDADDGVTVDVYAHSMGGVVSRSMIELPQEGSLQGHDIVDNLFLMGAPNLGTALANIANLGTYLVSLALTKSDDIFGGGMGDFLTAARDNAKGLADLRTDSEVFKALNARPKSNKVRYHALVGMGFSAAHDDANPNLLVRLRQKLIKDTLDNGVFNEENDMVIGDTSLRGVGGQGAAVQYAAVESDHFSYHLAPDAAAALEKWLKA